MYLHDDHLEIKLVVLYCMILLTLYTSLVRPTLETPILRRDQIRLENVQRRATKLIPELRDRDYEDRLRTLKLPSLYYRRVRGDMIEAYKFTHSIYKTEQEPLQRETNTTTRGHSYKLKKERCNTRTRANFFRHRINNRWNNLCDDVVTAPSLNSFKSRLDHQWCAYKYSNNNDLIPTHAHQHQSSTDPLKGEQPTKAEEDMYVCMYVRR